MKKSAKLLLLVIIIASLCGIAAGVYDSSCYSAVGVEAYLKDGDKVKVSRIREGYFFDGEGKDKALIFYPGAKVKEASYAPIMYALAEQGIDCFIVRMPLKMAFLNKDKADRILKKYKYESYYLAGHSLGGAMAANYCARHKSDYKGLFLLAAYPSEDLSKAKFPVYFIYGENDGVLNRKKLEKGFGLAPKNSQTIIIAGGNHAYFGSYKEQKDDGKATITPEEQQNITVDTIATSINE